jgi:hypothetical protein
MILITCNGRVLEARNVGPVKVRFEAGAVPIKFNGYRLLEDIEAAQILRQISDTGLYRGGKVTDG